MGVRSCSSTRLFLVVGHDVFESSLDSGQILDFSTEVINSTLCGQVWRGRLPSCIHLESSCKSHLSNQIGCKSHLSNQIG